MESVNQEKLVISFESHRLEGESFENYKLRQKIANKALTIYKRGDMVSFDQHLAIMEQKKEARKNKKYGRG